MRYVYTFALELPSGFRELRVLEENLSADGAPLLTRSLAEVTLSGSHGKTSPFAVDWHLAALPVISERQEDWSG